MINNTETLAVRESLLRQAASLLANPNASMTARQQLAGIIEGELSNNPQTAEQAEAARYRHLRDYCTREWDIHDYEEVLVRIPCGPGIQHYDDLDAIVDASIAAKEAADA